MNIEMSRMQRCIILVIFLSRMDYLVWKVNPKVLTGLCESVERYVEETNNNMKIFVICIYLIKLIIMASMTALIAHKGIAVQSLISRPTFQGYALPLSSRQWVKNARGIGVRYEKQSDEVSRHQQTLLLRCSWVRWDENLRVKSSNPCYVTYNL